MIRVMRDIGIRPEFAYKWIGLSTTRKLDRIGAEVLNKGGVISGTKLLSAASHHRAGSYAELTLEQPGKMRLVCKTGAQRDV